MLVRYVLLFIRLGSRFRFVVTRFRERRGNMNGGGGGGEARVRDELKRASRVRRWKEKGKTYFSLVLRHICVWYFACGKETLYVSVLCLGGSLQRRRKKEARGRIWRFCGLARQKTGWRPLLVGTLAAARSNHRQKDHVTGQYDVGNFLKFASGLVA